jgi:hypothetical protein
MEMRQADVTIGRCVIYLAICAQSTQRIACRLQEARKADGARDGAIAIGLVASFDASPLNSASESTAAGGLDLRMLVAMLPSVVRRRPPSLHVEPCGRSTLDSACAGGG